MSQKLNKALHSTMNIGIDMFAGPTEIGIIGDEEADANLICEDLCSHVEHGPESPVLVVYHK